MAVDFNPFDEYSLGRANGVIPDPAAEERFDDHIIRHGGNPDGGEVGRTFGFSGADQGKLYANWLDFAKVFGDETLPSYAGQQRGSCVSWGCRGACAYTIAHEILNGNSGKPEIPAEGLRHGAFSNEVIYWFRGHGGDGWQCTSAATVVTKTGGIVPRGDYTEELGVDLTTNSGAKEGKWGRTPPPPDKAKFIREHQITSATRLSGPQDVCDYLAAGKGVFFCSGLGWSKTRDENGYARQTGSWSHSQQFGGWDGRPEIVRKYGEPLVLILNSWGWRWQSGGRKVLGTDMLIPSGSYWAKSSLINRCSPIAFSGINGWKPLKVSTFGAAGNI